MRITTTTKRWALGLLIGAIGLATTWAISAENSGAPATARASAAPASAKAEEHEEHDGHDHAAEEAHDHAAEGAHDHARESTHADHDAPAEACVEGDGCADEAEGGHSDEVQLTPEAIRQNGIRTEPVRRLEQSDVLAVPGRVAYNAEAMAHIGVAVQGRVAEVRVKQGDTVAAGDVLLVIDSPALGEAQSALLQRRTDVEVARSARDVARLSSERAKRLHEGQGIALGELQKREGEFKAAEGALSAAVAAATAAENALRLAGMTDAEIDRLIKTGEILPRSSVRAPLAGRVVQREVTLGEVVGPERDGLLVLADLSVLWVLADVPEQRIGQLIEGASAEVHVRALDDRVFVGQVTQIAPELNRETRTIQVRIEIKDGGAPIKPGMFAQVSIASGTQSVAHTSDPVATTSTQTLIVPESAIQSFEGGSAVFVAMASEPGAFSARQVKLGPATGGQVPVLEGLEEGTHVVVDGAFIIKAELAKGIMEGKTCSGH